MARTTHDEPTAHLTAGASVRRRRSTLLTFTAVGALVGLLGFAGVFATGSDSAHTGDNDARSGEAAAPPADVDLQLASATYDFSTGAFACGDDWSDDLTSGVITSDGLPFDQQAEPTLASYDEGYFCIRNVGTQPTGVVASTFDVIDQEIACSPGEAEAGDGNCGYGIGELSQELKTAFFAAEDGTSGLPGGDATGVVNCWSSLADDGGIDAQTIHDLDGTPTTLDLGTLDPGEEQGVCADVQTDFAQISQRAQSDKVSWKYSFDTAEPVIVETPCETNDQYEPNQTFGAANGVVDEGHSIEAVTCSEDPDWFAGGSIDTHPSTFHATWEGDAQLTLTLLDVNGDVIGTSGPVSGGDAAVQAVPNDVYYIGVESSSAETTSYTVSQFEIGA